MDPNDPLLKEDGPCSVRLHVGGLGPTVIRNDLVRTFSSLGNVASVDFVRTKGRNFAYIDFQAASPQQIKRLFSLYNGCMWKGGRLKLEKAKEFYLDKLHREWEELKCTDEHEAEKSQSSTLTPTKTPPVGENSEGITIYFPHLKKVKTIPEKGLGKHKRSFERVQAMPFSLLQLCNCGDDCGAISTARCNLTSQQSRLDDSKGECANKNPLKNFKQDRTSKSNVDNIQTATSTESLNKKSHTANEDREKIQTGTSTELLDKTSDISQDVGINISKQSEENKIETTKDVDCTPRKRVRFDLESKNSENNSKESEISENKDPSSNTTGTNWVQKASWKALVGGTGRISFSLTTILGQNANKPMETVPVSNEKVKDSVVTNAVSSSTDGSGQPGPLPGKLRYPATESKSVIKGSHSEEKCQSHDEGETTEQQKQDSLLNTIMTKDKVCTFMKSDKSEKEWLQARRAVKGMVKRSHKDALRSMKMLHKKVKF